tara:strand:- start:280 stop:543 length:264 start_codon:yes stop_codon:yes gene_type:complete
MKPLTLTFHTDAGHGWLEIPKSIVLLFGKLINEVTIYSYQDKTNVYLEEDCDAPLFLNELRKRFDVKINEPDSVDESPIRQMKRMWN